MWNKKYYAKNYRNDWMRMDTGFTNLEWGLRRDCTENAKTNIWVTKKEPTCESFGIQKIEDKGISPETWITEKCQQGK
jgi:hypothetical protein